MKISKPEINYLAQTILTWTLINIALNLIGLSITKLLEKGEFTFMENIGNEFVKPLAIQTFLFSLCLVPAFIFLKNKKWSFYAFAFFQVLIFHLIFVLNLKIHPGIHFASTFHNPGIVYLSYCGQYLIDVLYQYFPINGNFENGAFTPASLGTFYIHWILLNIVYYFAITWISIRVANFFFENKIGKQLKVKPKKQTKAESRQTSAINNKKEGELSH